MHPFARIAEGYVPPASSPIASSSAVPLLVAFAVPVGLLVAALLPGKSPRAPRLKPNPFPEGKAVLREADGWEVRAIPFSQARALIQEHHYSKSTANTAVASHGLFAPGGVLVGAAMWMPAVPQSAKNAARDVNAILDTAAKAKGRERDATADQRMVLNLSRLVVVPDMPQNAASFLLGKSMRLLNRKRWPILITYADTSKGHKGGIYKATNWLDLGPSKAGLTWIDPTTGEQRGWKRGNKTYSASEMRAMGYVRQPQNPKIRFIQFDPYLIKKWVR